MKVATVKHASYAQNTQKNCCTRSMELHSLINFEPNKDMEINQKSVPCILFFNIRTTEPVFSNLFQIKKKLVMVLNHGQAPIFVEKTCSTRILHFL